MATKQKVFQYRYVEGLKDGNKLSELLEPILFASHTTVQSRSENLPGYDIEEEVRRCINHKNHSNDMVFGELILYERGTNKQTVTVSEELEELPTDQIRAPAAADGARREFIEGTVYFCTMDNHMVLAQSLSLRDRDLEAHLNWLLKDRTTSISDDEYIVLRRELSARAKKDMPGVRTVQIGAPLLYNVGPQTDGENKGKTTYLSDLGDKLLQAVVGRKELEALNLEQYGGADNLEVTLLIRRVGGKQKETPSEKAIKALTTHLRHTHEQDIEIRGKGVHLQGDKLYLTDAFSVTCNNGVPDRYSIFEKMREWLMKLINEGTVEP